MPQKNSLISTIVRPNRIALLIPTTMNEKDYRELLRFVGLVWGGKFSCIIPVDHEVACNQVVISILRRYSPDLIYFANNDIKNKLNKDITENINPPLQIETLVTPFIDNFRHMSLISNHETMREVIKNINSLPNTKSNFQFISTSQETANRIFYDLSFGPLEKDECEALALQTKSNSRHIADEGICEYIRLHNNNLFSYYDFSGADIKNTNSLEFAPTVFILSNSISDYSWFWNNRSYFSASSNNIIAFPIDSITSESAIIDLVEWIKGNHLGKSDYCRIKSVSASKKELNTLARKLRPRLKKFGYDHIDVIPCKQSDIPFTQFQHSTHEANANWIDENSFKIIPPKPSFANKLSANSTQPWIVEILCGDKLKGHIPPHVGMTTNTKVINSPSPIFPTVSIIGYSRRYSAGNIAVATSNNSKPCIITLPTAHELLIPYLNALGITEVADEKRLCYESTFNLFGDLRHFVSSCKNHRYAIISAMWPKRELPCENNGLSLSKGCHIKQNNTPSPVTCAEIKKHTRVGKDWGKPFINNTLCEILSDPIMLNTYKSRLTSDDSFFRRNTPQSFLGWLVEEKIARRIFFNPECRSCESNKDWGTKLDLEQDLRCSICGSTIHFSEGDIKTGYQINPLVFKAFKEGIRPVALTLSVLKESSNDGFMYLPGFKGKIQNISFDIDIVAICNGHIVLCECKDLENIPSTSKDWEKIKKQFEDLIKLGEKCSASSVILSSLATQYPKSIRQLVKKSSETIKIELLTKEDLIRGHLQIKQKGQNPRRAFFNEVLLPQNRTNKRKINGHRTTSIGNYP